MRGRQSTGMLMAAAIALGGCGGGSSSTSQAPTPTPTPNQTVEVTFTYAGSTTVDPAVDYETCSPDGVTFTTHLHFIWLGWTDRRFMNPVGADSFEYTDQVPVGRELSTALHDPNVCLEGDVYVAPTTLRANGALLTRVVPVRDGTGVAFTVAADGTVTP